MDREFTTAVYVIKGEKVLLHQHKKLGRWLPPGGHIEENELPDEGAIREVKEEMGIEVELIGKKADDHNYGEQKIKGLHSPFLMQLEDIPDHGEREAHQHIDLIYAARQIGDKRVSDGYWLTIEEIKEKGIEEEIVEHVKLAMKVVGEL